MTAWASKEQARATDWKDAQKLPDLELEELLEIATEGARAFAPPVPVDVLGAEVPPAGYRRAVILHAREIHAAAARSGDIVAGTDSYAIRARELSATVKQLLRPRRGRPGIG